MKDQKMKRKRSLNLSSGKADRSVGPMRKVKDLICLHVRFVRVCVNHRTYSLLLSPPFVYAVSPVLVWNVRMMVAHPAIFGSALDYWTAYDRGLNKGIVDLLNKLPRAPLPTEVGLHACETLVSAECGQRCRSLHGR